MALSSPVEGKQTIRANWLVGFLRASEQNRGPPRGSESHSPVGFGRGDTGGTVSPKGGDRHASQSERGPEAIQVGWRWKWSQGEGSHLRTDSDKRELFLLDHSLACECAWGPEGKRPLVAKNLSLMLGVT